MSRSRKPILWGLFAAGGTLAAFIMPALVGVIGLGVPLGLVPAERLGYEYLVLALAHPLLKLAVFVCLSLLAWHCAHRLRITAHDLGIRADRPVRYLCYGLAALATGLCFMSLFVLL